MARQSLPLTLTPLVLPAILLSALTPARAEAQKAVTGILVLSNTQWDSVRVELRVGPSTDCATNPPHVVRTLRRNQRWAIVGAVVICWRRELAPGDASTAWAGWDQARVASDSLRTVSL